MNSDKQEKDTLPRFNYQHLDNFKVDKENNLNNYPPLKKNPLRDRAESSISIDNSQLNDRMLNSNNKRISSPVISTSSAHSTPNTYHRYTQSTSDSKNLNQSNFSSINKYNNDNYDKNEKNPYLRPFSVNNKSMPKNNSIEGDNSTNYKPITYRNSLNTLEIENDVTSQLSSSKSNSTLSISTYNTNDNNNNNKNNNSNNYNNNNDDNNDSGNNDNKTPAFRLNDGSLKSYSKIYNMKKGIPNKSSKDKNSVISYPTSDIGSYYNSTNVTLKSVKPKSSISYQYESNRTLNNNTNASNINMYNSNNYLGTNMGLKKKYSSCYSISSNSTILAPPRKYLNNNTSIYSYPKLKHMCYVFILIIIIFSISNYSILSTTWLVVNTKSKESCEILIHYEFGMYKYRYNNNSTDDSPRSESVSEHCPKFCQETSCVNFNSNVTRFDDHFDIEDSQDPSFSFCHLTSKSRSISKYYLLLNLINLIVGASILYLTIKFREKEKGSLKNTIRKRLSIISEHYSFSIDRYRSKNNNNKNNNNNINNNNDNKNNNNNTNDKNNTATDTKNNNKNNEMEIISFGHKQYSEPESYDNESTSPSGRSGRITYNIPSSPTNVNVRRQVSTSESILMNPQVYLSPTMDEQNKQELDKETVKRKMILRILFTVLICLCIIMDVIGMYYVFKWSKQTNHINMIFITNSNINKDDINVDVSLGVSVILIFISIILNVIAVGYVLLQLAFIHYSKSKIYWANDGDDDMNSQSYDSSLHQSSYHYNPYIYNQNNYNSNTVPYIP